MQDRSRLRGRKGVMVELKGDRAMWEHVGCCELARSARSMSLFLAGKIEKDPLHFEFWRALLLSPFSMC